MRISEGLTKHIKITYNEVDKCYFIIAYDYLGNEFLQFPFNPFINEIE